MLFPWKLLHYYFFFTEKSFLSVIADEVRAYDRRYDRPRLAVLI